MILTKKKLKVLWRSYRLRLIKYAVLFVFFGIFFAFYSNYSLVTQLKLNRQIAQMKQENDSLESKIAQDKQLLYNLQNDDEALITFAREVFFMKKANEDVFIIK